MARALEISHLVISQYYRNKAGLGAKSSKSGAVTLFQRFGGNLNLNIHFHQLFEVLRKIIHKKTKYLERQKIIIKDDHDGTKSSASF